MKNDVNTTIIGDAIPRWGNKFSRALGKGFLTLAGWSIRGDLPNLPKYIIIVAPHTSNWDFFIGIATAIGLGIKAHWLGKHTIFRWPLKSTMTWLGGIPIDRTASHGVVKETVAIFNKRKTFILGVAPEGTRKKVRKWKSGFYVIALEAKVPIQTAFMDYAQKVVGFGPTIYPSGDRNADMTKIKAFYATVEGKRPQLS